MFCGECGRRLIYSRARGNGGQYEYFLCGGRQHGNCSQTSHRVEAVEAAVEAHYGTDDVEWSDEKRERLREAVAKHIEAAAVLSAEKVAEAELRLSRLEQEERQRRRAPQPL